MGLENSEVSVTENSNLLFVDNSKIIPANDWLRLINLFIDYFGLVIFCLLVGILCGLLVSEETLDRILKTPDIILGAPIFITYYVFFEAIYGRTPGKFMTGTKVVNAYGERASFLQIVGRTLCRLVPFEAFTFLSKKKLGLHDSVSKTYVVKCKN